MNLTQEDLEKLDNYIKGQATNSEEEFVEALFKNGENNLFLRQRLENDWNFISENESAEDKTDLTHVLDRIHHIIRRKESEKRNKPIQKILRIYSRVAAFFLIPLLLSAILLYSYLHQQNANENSSGTSEIYAPMGSRVSFHLPDGTKGVLNGGSTLSYSLPFSGNRKIKLEGEAWLEVKHDDKHPFLVNAGNSIVKVVGTSLNVSTYPNENYIEVVLRDGKVQFLAGEGDKVVTMEPSERLVYQQGQISKSVVDPEKYNGWIEGKLVFRSDSMTEVVRRIERWYNVTIILADKELEKYTFRATFQDDNLQDVLKFLAMTSPISYRINPRKVLTDGTYKKEEIIIYKRN